jgi:hypothetical protein
MEHKTAMALASAVVMVGGSGAVAVGTLTGAIGPDPEDVPAVPKADLRPIQVGAPGPATGKKPPVERVTRVVDVPFPAPAAAPAPPAPPAQVAPPVAALPPPRPVEVAGVDEAVDDDGAEDATEALEEQREERAERLEERREEGAEALEEQREERQDRLEDLADDSDSSGSGGDSSGSGSGDENGGSGHG